MYVREREKERAYNEIYLFIEEWGYVCVTDKKVIILLLFWERARPTSTVYSINKKQFIIVNYNLKSPLLS